MPISSTKRNEQIRQAIKEIKGGKSDSGDSGGVGGGDSDKDKVHDTLNATITSANAHTDKARAALDTANGYEAEDDAEDLAMTKALARQCVTALRTSADESTRAADAWDAKMKTDDQSEGEEGADQDGSTDDTDDGDGDESARKNRRPASPAAAKAAAEWKANAGGVRGKFISEKVYVNFRKRELAETSARAQAASAGPDIAPYQAEAMARAEWKMNKNGVRERFISEKVFVNARKRELAAS